MEKKNYKFTAFNKGNEIELVCRNVVTGITEEEAKMIQLGLAMGLTQKYKDIKVTFEEV